MTTPSANPGPGTQPAGSDPERKPWRATLGASACVILATLATAPWQDTLGRTNSVMLLLLSAVLAAYRFGPGPGLVAAVLSVVCFDFFYVPPRFSLSVAASESLVSFAVMLGISLVLGHLTAALREQVLEAELRADEAVLLHQLARDLGGAVDFVDLEQRLNAVLERSLGINAQLLLPDSHHDLHTLTDNREALGMLERLIAQGVWASGHALHANPDLRDDMLTLLLPLAGRGGSRGVLALHEPKAMPARELPEGLCDAITALVGAALARIDAELPRAAHPHRHAQH